MDLKVLQYLSLCCSPPPFVPRLWDLQSYLAQMFLYTIPASWLRCSMYDLPAWILHPVIVCWTVSGTPLHSRHTEFQLNISKNDWVIEDLLFTEVVGVALRMGERMKSHCAKNIRSIENILEMCVREGIGSRSWKSLQRCMPEIWWVKSTPQHPIGTAESDKLNMRENRRQTSHTPPSEPPHEKPAYTVHCQTRNTGWKKTKMPMF